MSYLSHLECGACAKVYSVGKIWNLCPECHKPLLVRYHLEKARAELNPDSIDSDNHTLWRYHHMLPVSDSKFRFSLGEGFTPLISANRLGNTLGMSNLLLKEEGLNPTGSFKARGLAMAISMAAVLGIKEVSIPSAGNAAGAMSAYAALAGMNAHVFMPKDVPVPFISECRALGAKVTLVDGLITDCGKVAAEGVKKYGRFDVSTLKEPYRIEGKKTMGYEIAEQLGWTLPDVILYPTGGGTGLIGMWKAFEEMEALGWIGAERPRMVSVQAEGCAPMVRAFDQELEFAEFWEGAQTIADGLRVPAAVGDFLILRALRESRGKGIMVSDNDMLDGVRQLGQTEGIFACPEGGAVVAACRKLLNQEWIRPDERVVLFNTGSGLKYAHLFSDG